MSQGGIRMNTEQENERTLSFRENVEAGMPVVCPSCGKTEKMDCMGNRGWKCPWCHAKILTMDDPQWVGWR